MQTQTTAILNKHKHAHPGGSDDQTSTSTSTESLPAITAPVPNKNWGSIDPDWFKETHPPPMTVAATGASDAAATIKVLQKKVRQQLDTGKPSPPAPGGCRTLRNGRCCIGGGVSRRDNSSDDFICSLHERDVDSIVGAAAVFT